MRKAIYILLFCYIPLVAQSASFSIRERIYVQTDKNTYLTGETVFVKLITTDQAGIPSALSKVAYIELLGEEEVKAQTKVAINNSAGSACLGTPIDLPTGVYRLVGYTQFMRNEGNEIFFEKKIVIINTLQNIETSNDSLNYKSRENNPRKISHISMSSDKTVYSVREKGNVVLKNIPQDLLTLSISITGNDILSGNNSTIVDWKNDLTKKTTLPFSNLFLPEYEGHILRGNLLENPNNNQSTNEEIITPFLSFVDDEVRVFRGSLNEKKEVYYVTKRANNFHQAVTTVFTEPANTKYRIDLLSPFSEHVFRKLPKVNIYESWLDELQKRNVALQSFYLFDSPVRIDHDSIKAYFQWKPDVLYNLDDYTRFSSMEDVIIEIVSAVRFRDINGKRSLQILLGDASGYIPVPTLVLLDGVPIMDHEDIFNYDPYNVKRIEVYRGRFVFGNSYCNGIVNFKSINNDLTNFRLNQSTQLLPYEMPQENVRFSTPDYSKKEMKNSHLPDFRHTLLWEPEVQIEGKNVIEIPFWTSDYTGEFKIVLEGITTLGEVVYSEEKFTVK